MQLSPVLPAAELLLVGAFLGVLLAGVLLRARQSGPAVAGVPILALVVALFAFALTGAAWAAWRAEQRLAERLPEEWEGRDLRLQGTVLTLPQRGPRGERFEFRVEAVDPPAAEVPRRILLSRATQMAAESSEDASADSAAAGQSGDVGVVPGDRWALTVRLRRPHGMSNPGGFDLESWLLQRQLRATGYVRDRPAAQRLGAAGFEPWLFVERLRHTVRERLERSLGDAPARGIVVGLAIGDQSGITDAQWDLFSATGTTHLMSISGLHVTMLASLLGVCAGSVWRRVPALCLRWPARRAAMVFGLVGAAAYTLLAGYGIPAQRTLYMLAVAALALWSGRAVSVRRVLLLALVVVLLADPWAVLAAGFWLSFAAVGVLLYAASAAGSARSGTPGWLGWLREWGMAQWAVTVGSLPLMLWLFQQVSLVSPLANAVAIPLVSGIVGPLAVASAVLPLEWPAWLAERCLSYLLDGLALIGGQPWSFWQQAQPPLWAVLLGCAGVLLLLLPRGIPGRAAGAVLLVPVAWPPLAVPPPGEAIVDVLDVGHGLAALVRTSQHALLFDTGPRFGPESDAGQRVVAPALRAMGVARLDALVLSHEDSDHAGGLASLLREVPVVWWMTTLPDEHPLRRGGPEHHPCLAGGTWTWDGVRFEVLYPGPEPFAGPRKPNQMSCVVRVVASAGAFLLTGDIEKKEESWLLDNAADRLPAPVLQVPHQGSRSSSTASFVQAVGAQHAIIPVGYRNRYRHPHPSVVERYAQAGIRVWRTDRDGAVRVHLGTPLRVHAQRELAPRYWQGR